MLNRYYEKIRLVECGIDLEGQDGALLFAVRIQCVFNPTH